MKYTVSEFEFEDTDDDDDKTWDANDWRFTVVNGDEIIAICASEKEAAHIARLLNDDPIPE